MKPHPVSREQSSSCPAITFSNYGELVSQVKSLSVAALALTAAASFTGQQPSRPQALVLSGEYQGVHDPSIAFDHGTYYVFATGAATAVRPPAPGDAKNTQALAQIPQFPIRCSEDLHRWRRCGEVFPAIPLWIQQTSPKTTELWAPDISFYDGIYHLYYAFSLFGKNSSGIALATNETLDPKSSRYKWIDRGVVLRSTAQNDFNAIDPNLILDEKGEPWLSFGSFWSGIKMRQVNRRTGLLSTTNTKLYSLASRGKDAKSSPHKPDLPPDSEAIEAPFVILHDGSFYLFVSYDLCCRGLKSTYRTMVGRSKNVTGPYSDRDGKLMIDGGGSPLLTANGKWLGPGGESLLQQPGKDDLIVFHAYSAVDGHPALHISTIGWKDGWPSASLEGDGRPPLGLTSTIPQRR
jgi:arabinan endo-1,5-alpha-L-arabinosidase